MPALTPLATIAEAEAIHGTEYIVTSCDRDRDGVIDTAAFDLALQAASDEVRSLLAGRVLIDAADVPSHIKRHVVNLAVYHTSSTRHTLTDQKEKLAKMAYEWIDRIVKSQAAYDTAEPVTPPKNHALSLIEYDTPYSKSELDKLL